MLVVTGRDGSEVRKFPVAGGSRDVSITLAQLFVALFPDGLTFAADRTPDGKRQIWRITGDIDLESLIDPTTPNDCANPAMGRVLHEMK